MLNILKGKLQFFHNFASLFFLGSLSYTPITSLKNSTFSALLALLSSVLEYAPHLGDDLIPVLRLVQVPAPIAAAALVAAVQLLVVEDSEIVGIDDNFNVANFEAMTGLFGVDVSRIADFKVTDLTDVFGVDFGRIANFNNFAANFILHETFDILQEKK